MKIGDKVYDTELQDYGIVTGVGLGYFGPYAEFQRYRNGKPVGTPTVSNVTQLILVAIQIWDMLHPAILQLIDLLTPDPDRVAARVEARRIRREARKHLPK